MGGPPAINHLNRLFFLFFHCKPSILGVPHLWKPPCLAASKDGKISSFDPPSLTQTLGFAQDKGSDEQRFLKANSVSWPCLTVNPQ